MSRHVNCFICDSICNTSELKKDNHHVLYEERIRYYANESGKHYANSWKKSLTVTLCRRCHEIYHRIYKSPTVDLEELVYNLPASMIERTIEYINDNNIKCVLNDAIQSSCIVFIAQREWCGKDYFSVCEEAHVVPGRLYDFLIKKTASSCAFSDIPIFPERIPAFVLDEKHPLEADPIYPDSINDVATTIVRVLGYGYKRRRGVESIARLLKHYKRFKMIRKNTVLKALDILCDRKVVLKEEKNSKNYYSLVGSTQSNLF